MTVEYDPKVNQDEMKMPMQQYANIKSPAHVSSHWLSFSWLKQLHRWCCRFCIPTQHILRYQSLFSIFPQKDPGCNLFAARSTHPFR